MPEHLAGQELDGRTAARSTSTTRLDFSSITPIRIQVLYWVSITKTRISPITDGAVRSAVVAPGCEALHRERLGAGQLCGLGGGQAGGLEGRRRHRGSAATARTSWAVVEVSLTRSAC